MNQTELGEKTPSVLESSASRSRVQQSEDMLTDTSPEFQRLAALARYQLEPDVSLDQQSFERLVAMAARLFSVQTALISFIGDGWQWWGATCGMNALGLPGTGMDASQSMCSTVVASGKALQIPDMAQHETYRSHPLASENGVRFYASEPLLTPDGYAIGTLCVMDPSPRVPLTSDEQQTLTDLAQLVMDELELRLLALRHERQASASDLLSESLREALAHAETLQAISALSELGLSIDELLFQAVALCASVCDVDLGSLVAIHDDRAFIFPAWHSPSAAGLAGAVSRGLKRGECEQIWTSALSQQQLPMFSNNYGSQAGAHLAMVQGGVVAQAYAPMGGRGETRFLMVLSRVRRDRPWRPYQRQLVTAVARMMRDLSQQRRQEEELGANSAQLNLALSSAPLVLFSVDRAGIFRLVRGSSEETKAWESLVGRGVDEAFQAVPQVLHNIRRAISGENFEDVVRVADQTYDVRYIHAQDAAGQPAGALGLGYNVTGLAQAEQRATAAQREAEALLDLAQTVTGDVLNSVVADSALDSLSRATDGGWLILWELRGEKYFPVSQRGSAPGLQLPRLDRLHSGGVSVSVYDSVVGVVDRNVYLRASSLPEALTRAGVGGLAALPLTVKNGQCQVGLVAYLHRPWKPAERELLETACAIFGAGLERRQRMNDLEHDAATDALTGVGNRRALNLALVAALDRAAMQRATLERPAGNRETQRDSDSPAEAGLSVVSIDLDGLKSVNDLHGHARGDALLSQFAADLRSALPVGGELFRLGGDEFVAVYPVGPSAVDAPPKRAAVSARKKPGEKTLAELDWLQVAVEATRRAGFAAASASAGAARFPEDASSAADLLRLSDERLYAEKERRGNGRVAATEG
ncbi:GAF domain-containing protein [Deinococcus sp. UYEF24]